MTRTALDLATEVYGPLAALLNRNAARVLDRAERIGPAHLDAALGALQALAEEVAAAVVAGYAAQAEPASRAAVIETEAQKIMDSIVERARAKLYAAVVEG